MHDGVKLPDLTFPNVEFGKTETHWNMNVLLYLGGAAAEAKLVSELIANSTLGEAQLERLELVTGLHEEISSQVSSGGARATAIDQLTRLRAFFSFADRSRKPLTLDTVVETYCVWADSPSSTVRAKFSRFCY